MVCTFFRLRYYHIGYLSSPDIISNLTRIACKKRKSKTTTIKTVKNPFNRKPLNVNRYFNDKIFG